MKPFLFFLLLSVALPIALGCNNNKTPEESIVKENIARDSIIKEVVQEEKVFNHLSAYPVIKDSAQFIADLRKVYDLKVEESPVQKEQEKITTYKKIKLYGSDKAFYFIEYDYAVGSMASYPWKCQVILTADGKPVKTLNAYRFEFVSVFPKQHPLLLTVVRTAKGNGGHELYKVSADTLENVYEGYYDYSVRTYDKHEDMDVNEPNELRLQFKDVNKDGFKDMVFTGKKLMLGRFAKDSFWYDVEVVNGREEAFTVEHPGSIIPLKYVFLYDKRSGHFKAKGYAKTSDF
ncbi:MAG TPA: hypothetical protein VIM79_04555 [Niastella sp.]